MLSTIGSLRGGPTTLTRLAGGGVPQPSLSARRQPGRTLRHRPMIMAVVQSSNKILVVSSPTEEQIKEMKKCPTWGCEVSKFPWSYDASETCLMMEGQVLVTPDGGEPVEVKAGDMATFPAGMSCTWDVKKRVHKHYKFH